MSKRKKRNVTKGVMLVVWDKIFQHFVNVLNLKKIMLKVSASFGLSLKTHSPSQERRINAKFVSSKVWSVALN